MSSDVKTNSYAGFWWLPENPSRKVAGFLSFAPGDKITLNCFEPLKSVEEPGESGPITFSQGTYRAVFGEIMRDGRNEKITVVNARYVHLNVFMFMHQPDNLTAEYLLIGTHISDEMNFNNFEARFTLLDAWVGYNPFRFKHEMGESDNLLRLQHEFVFPEVKKFSLPAINGELSFPAAVSAKGLNRSQYTLAYQTYALFQSKERLDLRAFISVSYQVQILLSILIGRMTKTVGYYGARVYEVAEGEAIRPPERFEVHYNAEHPWVEASDKSFGEELLTSFVELEGNFQNILDVWFGDAQRYKEAAELYYDNLHEDNYFTSLRFLTTAQAVETAHRRLFGDSTFKEEEKAIYRVLEKELMESTSKLNGLGETAKARIQEKMRFIPDTTLRERLNDLLQRTRYSTFTLIPDPTSFNKTVRCSRNYYTHYAENLRKCAADGYNLVRLTVQLEGLLTAVFFMQLGFTQEEIAACFERVKKFKDVIDENRKASSTPN